ncbi:MAG: hypothetical protein DRH11_17565 [Deltaproteobacteria bacterium]|nr:hypothetical protein [Deltaproteobacteria bacterium]RLB28275.1 MAG: hypothetical protein DRH11_17565 [Deltaproteobacteria bacterium]
MENWWVYIVEKGGKLRVGITTDLENRLREQDAKRPSYYEGPMPKAAALKRERTLRGFRREKKLELIGRDTSRH